MTNSNELHVVFGTGPLGQAVMRELVRQGKRVRMVNRQGRADVPAEVEVVRGDASSVTDTREVCKGANVVYNCVGVDYTRWVELFPAIQAGLIEGAASSGAKLVSGENLYMYGPTTRPITEDLPYSATTRKGVVRAKMAEELLSAHKKGIVRATAGRASNFYGPGAGPSGIFGDRVLYPMLAGKKVAMLGNVDLPHTFSYIEDYGKGLVVLGAHEEALGQAWHIPNAPTTTTRAVLIRFFEIAGLPVKIGAVPNMMVKALGLVNPLMREVGEMLYEFNEPFVVDSSKFVRAFGDISTPQDEAIRQTLAWFRANPAPQAQPKAA